VGVEINERVSIAEARLTMLKKIGSGVLVGLVSLALSATVAGAITLVYCTGTNPCEGTEGVDRIQGTDSVDEIYAYGSEDDITAGDEDDKVYGGSGGDFILADWSASGSEDAGNDEIYGEGRVDYMYGGGGTDLIDGGPGNDYLDAIEFPEDVPGEDTVLGGSGNDKVYADDGLRDVINCGGGKKDRVTYDKGLDTVTKCERKVAR
jgi:Ca2+-binding RTX toxin-like protein